MNGFILDGFPKNINQLYSLEDMRVTPTILIILEGNETTFMERVKNLNKDIDGNKNIKGYSE
jgi:adenylate kinase family enzyme